MRKRGHVRRRGKHSWEIKIDCGRDATGNRVIHYYSVKGTERDANKKLTELLKSRDDGAYVAPNKETVADFVRARVTHWETSGHISPRSAERYRQLVEHQIVPHLGTKQLRDLRPRDIESWHTTLRKTLEPRTVGHAHRVLSKALRDAVTNEELIKNVAKTKTAPKVTDEEMGDSEGRAGFDRQASPHTDLRTRHDRPIHRHEVGRSIGVAVVAD
jgi:hypothetical protein